MTISQRFFMQLAIFCVIKNQALELSWGHDARVFLSWTRSRSPVNQEDHKVALSRQLGEKLGLRDGEQGFLRSCQQVLSVQQVFVEPLSSDDWEILELHSAELEQQLLDQIRVVFPDAVFPVWVDQRTVIYIRIASLTPTVPYGRLEQFTELHVSPKIRAGSEDLSCAPSGSSLSNQNMPLHRQPNFDLSPSSRSSQEFSVQGTGLPVEQHPNAAALQSPRQWGGIADVKSLVRYMLTGNCDPVRETPPIPTIPALLSDSVFRVCRAPPVSPGPLSATHGVAHILPWGQQMGGNIHGGQPAVTYGLLSKVLSPKEVRERAKQAMEKKKGGGAGDAPQPGGAGGVGDREEKEDATVVKVVCHLTEGLKGKQGSSREGELHSGRVWVSTRTEAMVEFALTVLKSEPEPESKAPDQLFLLAPCVIQKTDIQVLVTSFLIRTGFNFLSHSLMGRPLSWELVSTGRGLRGGALLITGAKGSGKTALSRALCRKTMEDLDAHVEVVDCKKLKGKRAETVRQILEEVFEQAVWRQPSVVLLDDLDHVTGAPTSPEHEHGPEALLRLHIAQSLRDMVHDVVVRSSLVSLVVSSHSEHSLHPSLREVQGSHFLQGFIHIQPPDQAQRGEILRCLILSKTAVSKETLHTLDLGIIAKETEGYLPRDLALLLERAIHSRGVNPGVCLSWRDFVQALKGFTPPTLWGAQLQSPSGAGLERVGGLHQVRQLLMDTILLPAKYPVLFSSLPIRQRSGLLLYGAPGTGKTLLAGAVAKESGMNFISIKGPELLSKYIGASEQAIRDVFQRAQAATPCILFFDEFDSLAPRRGHDNTGVTDRVVNQLLTQLDGVEGLQGVYVLAATSRPDLIDPALLRPGRLDKSLYCPPPDQEARVEILRALSHSVPLADDVDLEQMAGATDTFTGADLKALLYNAQLEAIHSSLGPSLLHDLGSGSDSDISLSSMIFLNHSSGSDDSTGEGERGCGLDHSMVLLDLSDVPPEDPRGNIWRLYFGSSFESELGNPSPSGLNSQGVSGPNSNDLTGASVRDPGFSHPPAYMSSLQDGYEELSHEQLDRLRLEISNIKSNYRRATEDSVPVQGGPIRTGLLLCQAHLTSALNATRASLSNLVVFCLIRYESFGASGEGKSQSTVTFKPGQRVTLA
uniref:Peroxisomal ATPase PEX1 n=1 Tax=Oncorhynchus tshawytscha TaxID=74940 RepID=A0AAZ3NQ93_ONCTS